MKVPVQEDICLIEELQCRIQILENENRLLKNLLDDAGMPHGFFEGSDLSIPERRFKSWIKKA